VRRREFITFLGGAEAWPLKVAKSLGIGAGTIQRIANELR